MGDSDSIKCVVCADDATPRVVKDKGYNAMMGLLWEAMKVDVKYTENVKFDLCAPCFNKILHFYDLNDGCVIMEKRIQLLTKKLINKGIAGVAKAKEEGLPLVDVHEKIVEKYGTKPLKLTEADANGVKYEYEFECKVVDTATESKAPAVPIKLGEPRKTIISFVAPADPKDKKKESQVAETESPKSRLKGKARSSRGRRGRAAAGRGAGRGAGRKRRKNETSEEEDVYTSSSSSSESEEDSPAKSEKTVSVKNTTAANKDDDQDLSTEAEEDEKVSEKSPSETGGGRSKKTCGVCLEVLPNDKAYESHVRRHTVAPGAGFQCRICRKAYEAKEDYVSHKKLHDEGKYPCPVCSLDCGSETKISPHIKFGHKDFWTRDPQTLCKRGSGP